MKSGFIIPRRHVRMTDAAWHDLDVAVAVAPEPDPETIALWEDAIARFVESPHAVAVNSGRRGMTLIFEHMGLGPEDEVIVPAYTLADLIPLIQGFGAKVVCADVDPRSFNVTAETVAARITSRTRAILVLHTFGVPCEIERILEVARPFEIPVIEDCAHALGATVNGRAVGTFGYAGFFSFEATKPVNTFGGGMVVTRDGLLAGHIRASTRNDEPGYGSVCEKANAIRQEQKLFRLGLAFPFLYLLATPWTRGLMTRLYRRAQHAPPGAVGYTAYQARLGLEHLKTLPERIAARQAQVDCIKSLLKPEIQIQAVREGAAPTWYFLVAKLPVPALRPRKRLLMRRVDAGIEHEVADDCAAILGQPDCPNAAEVYSRAIALPMFDGMADAMVERVARAVNAVVR